MFTGKLDQVLTRMHKRCSYRGIAKVPGVASASVSRAVNSEDIQVLARKYDFEIELINSKRECVLDYKTA